MNKQWVGGVDYGCIVLCAMRYAIGRRTYMTGLVADYIKKNWLYVNAKDRAFLLRDLTEEIVHGEANPAMRWLGDDCDVASWMELQKFMKENMNAPIQEGVA